MNKPRTWLPIVLVIATWWAIILGQPPNGNQWETEIKKFEESDRQNPPPKSAVLFLGSSSIRLWQSLAEDFRGIEVINRGFGGSQIVDSILYVNRIVIPYQPKIVVLYAGDNDLASGKTPWQVLKDFKKFVSLVHLKLPETKIAFISIKPSPARASLLQSMKEANGLIKDYTLRDKKLSYIDVFTPMLAQDGKPRSELFIEDRLHMNRDGYELWKSVIAPYIR
jgi:lysophospholipase L1-like esterase